MNKKSFFSKKNLVSLLNKLRKFIFILNDVATCCCTGKLFKYGFCRLGVPPPGRGRDVLAVGLGPRARRVRAVARQRKLPAVLFHVHGPPLGPEGVFPLQGRQRRLQVPAWHDACRGNIHKAPRARRGKSPAPPRASNRSRAPRRRARPSPPAGAASLQRASESLKPLPRTLSANGFLHRMHPCRNGVGQATMRMCGS